MKNQINVWKSISLVLLVIAISLGYLFYSKNRQSEVVSVTQMEYENLPLVDYSENFKTDEVPDGERLYDIGSVLRIDGMLVDDQYYTYLFPVNSSIGFGVEIANDVIIKIFKDFNVSTGKVISVDLVTFRKIMRDMAKDAVASTTLYKVKIKNNLVESIEQVR